MKILVPISKVPDTTAKISFVENNSKFNSENVQFIMNPVDEWYALVRALELKEKFGGSVSAINVGLSDNDQIIRKALAIGADDAVRIDIEPTDAYQVAFQIFSYAKEQSFDLIIGGKETIDFNGFQVGGMIAELLDWPYVNLSVKMEVEENTATIHREIEGGHEIVEVSLPMVVGAAKGIAEQRIPNMRGIMAARTKPLNVIPPVAVEPLTFIEFYSLPPQKQECKLVDPDKVDELVDLLHSEAKVI